MVRVVAHDDRAVVAGDEAWSITSDQEETRETNQTLASCRRRRHGPWTRGPGHRRMQPLRGEEEEPVRRGEEESVRRGQSLRREEEPLRRGQSLRREEEPLRRESLRCEEEVECMRRLPARARAAGLACLSSTHRE
ncbi:MAG: hypothetical protein M5U08_22615 [Burkholderiales bacterium]|nr:hypothetical protein [Burkholderiales bacterium]